MSTQNKSKRFQRPVIALSLTLALILLAGCNLPTGPTAASTPSSTPLSLPPMDTPTPITPTSTFTSTLAATPSISPTPSPTLTQTLTPSPEAIVFSLGTTADVVQGTLQANEVKVYTLNAQKQQPMILMLSSQSGGAYLAVSDPDGDSLLDPSKKWTDWQWLLPKTGTYSIYVYAGPTAGTYTLTAKVAAIVTFSQGAISKTLTGTTPNGYVLSYSLACRGGQTMTVSLNLPASSAYLDVFGLGTGTLLSPSSHATSWTGTLPATQDYIVEIIPANGQVVNYTLTVTVQ